MRAELSDGSEAEFDSEPEFEYATRVYHIEGKPMSQVNTSAPASPGFQIFRAGSAPSAEEVGVLSVEGVSSDVQARINEMVSSGIMDGQRSKVLFSFPGFSLIYFWFKRDFPLPLHTHDTDCLYYVVAGSTRVGTETLRAGDGLFVPKEVAYSHHPGADGVEILEFRHTETFNFRYKPHADSPFWDRAIKTIVANRDAWLNATPPSAASDRHNRAASL